MGAPPHQPCSASSSRLSLSHQQAPRKETNPKQKQGEAVWWKASPPNKGHPRPSSAAFPALRVGEPFQVEVPSSSSVQLMGQGIPSNPG